MGQERPEQGNVQRSRPGSGRPAGEESEAMWPAAGLGVAGGGLQLLRLCLRLVILVIRRWQGRWRRVLAVWRERRQVEAGHRQLVGQGLGIHLAACLEPGQAGCKVVCGGGEGDGGGSPALALSLHARHSAGAVRAVRLHRCSPGQGGAAPGRRPPHPTPRRA